MNRKYIRLRRFLGISTILLGLLIAIIPTFSRAATDIKATVAENNWQNYGEGYISVEYHFAGDVDPNYSIKLYLYSQYDGPNLEQFIQQGLVEVGEKDQAVPLYISESGRDSGWGDYTVELTMPMPEYFDEISGDDIDVYRIETASNQVKVFDDVGVEKRGDIQVVTVFTDAIAANSGNRSYAFVYVKRNPESTPTDTPTPSPTNTPTPKPTARPTTRPSGTPTPTAIPLRLAQIDDQRSDKSDTKGLSAMVYGGTLPNTILIVRDSDGVGIKRIVVLRKGMKMKAWNLRLVDDQKRNITDFRNLTVTLPIPASWDLSRGRVSVVGTGKNGKIKVFDTDIVDQNGFQAAKFVIEEFTDHEYAMIYTPEGVDDEMILNVSDNRADKTGTEYISGSVTEGSGKRTLYIKDSDSEVIRQRIVWKSGMLLDRYRIWIGDEDGNVIDDGFGTLTVTLPLSEDMDPAKGTIRVVGSTPDKATDDFLPEIIKNDDGTYSVRFSTDYFSDYEYGVVYTPYTVEPEATNTPTPTTANTPTPTKAGTPTPTLSPTPYANQTNTPTPTKKPTATPKPTGSADPLITGKETGTPTPTKLPTGPTGSSGRGPGSGPIVTPRGGSFTENGVSMNYAKTGNNGGSAGGNGSKGSSGTAVKGGSSSNVKDMPKTGMADVPRMLLVVILIALGSIQIVTTIPMKKE